MGGCGVGMHQRWEHTQKNVQEMVMGLCTAVEGVVLGLILGILLVLGCRCMDRWVEACEPWAKERTNSRSTPQPYTRAGSHCLQTHRMLGLAASTRMGSLYTWFLRLSVDVACA